MEPQNPHYHFGECSGNNSLLPVSAFSAYSLLRNCNYLFSSQPSEISRFRGSDPPIRTPSSSEIEQPLLGKTLLSPSLFSYPHICMPPNEPVGSRSPLDISPCSSIYGTAAYRRQRGEKKPIPEEQKDEKYFERRKRNNQAAKKSRDARKIREDQIALRATILEHENAILRAQILTLREEASSLRQMLLQKKALELATRDSQICIT